MFVTCLRRYHSFKLFFFYQNLIRASTKIGIIVEMFWLAGADVIVTIDVRNRKSRIILVADCPGKIFETDIQLFSPSLSVLEQASVIELMIKKHCQASQFSELLHWRAIRLSCRMSKLLMSRGIKDMNTSQTKFHLLCLTKVTSALNGWGWTRFLHLKRL